MMTKDELEICKRNIRESLNCANDRELDFVFDDLDRAFEWAMKPDDEACGAIPPSTIMVLLHLILGESTKAAAARPRGGIRG